LHHVHFSKINNAINNKGRQQQKRDDNGKDKKPFKKCRTSFSAKCAQNDCELVKESYKDVSGRDCEYKSNKDNYRAEKRKSMSCQEDRSMEKRKTGANINDDKMDCDRIENKNSNDNDNDKKSEKENFKHDMNGKTAREMEL